MRNKDGNVVDDRQSIVDAFAQFYGELNTSKLAAQGEGMEFSNDVDIDRFKLAEVKEQLKK